MIKEKKKYTGIELIGFFIVSLISTAGYISLLFFGWQWFIAPILNLSLSIGQVFGMATLFGILTARYKNSKEFDLKDFTVWRISTLIMGWISLLIAYFLLP